MEKRVNKIHEMFDYKWIALSNTTLGVLMAALNSSIILISLPTIFRGIDINPLAPSEIGYLVGANGVYGNNCSTSCYFRANIRYFRKSKNV